MESYRIKFPYDGFEMEATVHDLNSAIQIAEMADAGWVKAVGDGEYRLYREEADMLYSPDMFVGTIHLLAALEEAE